MQEVKSVNSHGLLDAFRDISFQVFGSPINQMTRRRVVDIKTVRVVKITFCPTTSRVCVLIGTVMDSPLAVCHVASAIFIETPHKITGLPA